MNRYDRLSGFLDEYSSGVDTAKVPMGVIGGYNGRNAGFKRYATVERLGLSTALQVSVYGNVVARVFEDGSALVNTLGYFTPSTKAALEVALDGRGFLHRPGLRNPDLKEPWHIAIVCKDRNVALVTEEWTAVPSDERAEK